jgi:hypothetical protein
MLYGQYDSVEIWKRHPVYYRHSCSTMGRVRRDACVDKIGRRLSVRVLQPFKSGHGSWELVLDGYEKRHTHTVGRLVLETFAGPCLQGEEACHGRAGRDCHRLSNLYWGTELRNMSEDKARDGTVLVGESHPCAKLTSGQVLAIRQDHRALSIVASCYGVSKTTVSEIRSGKTWRHLEFAA